MQTNMFLRQAIQVHIFVSEMNMKFDNVDVKKQIMTWNELLYLTFPSVSPSKGTLTNSKRGCGLSHASIGICPNHLYLLSCSTMPLLCHGDSDWNLYLRHIYEN